MNFLFTLSFISLVIYLTFLTPFLHFTKCCLSQKEIMWYVSMHKSMKLLSLSWKWYPSLFCFASPTSIGLVTDCWNNIWKEQVFGIMKICVVVYYWWPALKSLLFQQSHMYFIASAELLLILNLQLCADCSIWPRYLQNLFPAIMA